ncbi:MAG: ribose-phosphate diphosphokinase [Saccharofermentans sp.]|jgi:ribose-phosphate pyrophosphokinase|nr:ribose-phosphate diphosphokinase [Mageeibacillus sp.]MCI1263346.1 ribose-phosphate diphosphokinase [Saccharofermentans sp.]MCI1275406.1 ribose-phosphate diphosphokinase [Saccharofermentans sp.]MCI1769006.1 ribose-phosphate diphosphokinase [Mageeibacillus sp.]MCI2043942.1 ribose-phosphate diphosphokinase [Mageeibacillus sp.]
MSDLYVNSGFKQATLAPFGPIGIIAHTTNIDFVRKVSDVLSSKRNKRIADGRTQYASNPGYARSDYLIDSKLIRFQSGEGKCALGESVRGNDIYIITDVLAHNGTVKLIDGEHVISSDDHYMDLLRIISVCRGKARRINVIMPFVYEGRREKLDTRGESYDCADVLKKLYSLGVANLIVFDPHDARIANAVPLMSIEYPRCQFKLTSALLSKFGSIKLDKDNTIVVSPDETGVSRAIFYSSHLNLPLGIFYRDRDYTIKVNGEHPIKEFRYLGDDVKDRDILLIDDMINSGSTMLRTAAKLKTYGAGDIYCLSPFGLFTEGFDGFDKAYEEGIIKSVCCTNLVYHPEGLDKREWYLDADMVPYVARIIDALNVDESIYDLINSTSRLTELVSQIRIGEVFDEFNE